MKNIKDYILTENNFFKNLGIGMRPQIEKWLDRYCDIQGEYTINPDLTIDVNGGVFFYKYTETELPEYIQFGVVTEYFDISNSPKLKTLRGCPQKVGRTFDCSKCPITSLEGAPKEVGSNFYCYDCPKLESLKGCPQKVNVFFNCYNCKNLVSLEGAPKEVGGCFNCYNCKNLVSLEGAPKYVGGNFSCSGCEKLTTISGNQNKVDIHFFCIQCGKKFTKDDIKKHFKIKGQIFV